ncbi:MAG TPA: alpha/beta hydrolase [Trebonia sp.]|nr:alpha/beta hydrolase [Trebonia sp.]
MTDEDVVYADHGGRALHLDVYKPSADVSRRTAVLVLHGGGWRAGDRKAVKPRCEALARHGFTALAVEYRFVDEAPWPHQIADVRAAVGWTHSHAADLGIDPDKIVLQGHSAGAHLSLLTAGTWRSNELGAAAGDPESCVGSVAAVVAYYPPVRLAADRPMPSLDGPLNLAALRAVKVDDGSVPAAMLLGTEISEGAATAASPITYAREGFPPVIVFQGTEDTLVGSSGAFEFMRAMHAAQVPCEVHYFAGANHEFDMTPFYTQACIATVDAFLHRHVLNPEAAAEEILQTNPLAAMAQTTG